MPALARGQHRDIEVDDLGALAGPEQIARLDVAVIDIVAMQVHQPVRHLPCKGQGIVRGEQPLVDHLADIQPLDVVEHDEGRTTAGQKVRVDNPHHVRMIGNPQEGAVFLLQPLQRRVAILQYQLDGSRDIAEGIHHLVDHAEGAGTTQAFLHHVLVGELRAWLKLGVVHGCRGFRLRLGLLL